MANDAALQAVKTFEFYSKSTLTLHDYTGEIEAMLPIDLCLHLNTFCKQIKKNDATTQCVACDMQLIKQRAAEFPDGGLKLCPAGVLEYFYPVFVKGQLEAVLFAGLWQQPQELPADIPLLAAPENHPAAETALMKSALPMLPVNESLHILEALRQLAARLLQFSSMHHQTGVTAEVPRKRLIMQLARKYYNRPNVAELIARAMHLSDSRMRHVVRKETGLSLQNIVTDIRLARVQIELRDTDLPVQAIAEANGFGNISHFFRLFKKRFGISPLQFRLNKKS